jgi:hypothetical protein
VPTRRINFYWPPTYYHPDSKVAIEYDLTSRLLLVMNNTGNRSEYFSEYMFDSEARAIPGTRNEKSMKMYMRERVFNDDVDPWNLEVHEGPTVILVKTAAFTTTTRSARATATRRPYSYDSDDDDDDDDGPRLSGGAIAGIVIGAIVGLVFIISCCCCGCCGKKKDPKPKIDPEQQARIVAQGVELMEQGKVVQPHVQNVTPTVEVGMRATDVDIERMEQARAPAYSAEAPPPKYTP